MTSSSCVSAGKPEWKAVLSSMTIASVQLLPCLLAPLSSGQSSIFPEPLTCLRGQNMSGVFWKKLTPDRCVWGREKGQEFRQVNKSCAVLPTQGPESSSPFTSSIAAAAKKKTQKRGRSSPPLLLASKRLFRSINWFHHRTYEMGTWRLQLRQFCSLHFTETYGRSVLRETRAIQELAWAHTAMSAQECKVWQMTGRGMTSTWPAA